MCWGLLLCEPRAGLWELCRWRAVQPGPGLPCPGSASSGAAAGRVGSLALSCCAARLVVQPRELCCPGGVWCSSRHGKLGLAALAACLAQIRGRLQVPSPGASRLSHLKCPLAPRPAAGTPGTKLREGLVHPRGCVSPSPARVSVYL